MNQPTRLAASLAAASLLALGTSSAFAAGAVWDTALGPGSGSGATSATPWIAAPATGSLYAEWNYFTDDSGPTVVDSTPDIASFGLGAGAASLTETTGFAFIPGSGNVYSFSGATAFSLSLPGGSGIFDVWLRASTQGTLPNTTATLNGVAATAVQTYTAPAGGMGGDEKEMYWKWSVASAPTYSFAFSASGSSMSLDQLAVYAAPVPEPSTYAMLGLGLAGLALARGRRRRS